MTTRVIVTHEAWPYQRGKLLIATLHLVCHRPFATILPSAESRRDLVELFGYRSIPGTVEAKCLSHSKSIPLSIGLLLFFMLTLRVRAEPIPAICVGT